MVLALKLSSLSTAMTTLGQIPGGTGAAGSSAASMTAILQAELNAFTDPIMLALYVVAIVGSLVSSGAMVLTQSSMLQTDAPISLGQALATSVRRLPAMLLAALLSGLALLVGFILLIIPVFYVGGKLQLWLAAMFVDNASPLEALSTSWRLTRGRWWRGAGILTIAVVIVYVISLAFGLVAGIAMVVAPLGATGKALVPQAFTLAANVLTFPLFVAVWLAMYNDFKLRSQGGDLAARVGALGKA